MTMSTMNEIRPDEHRHRGGSSSSTMGFPSVDRAAAVRSAIDSRCRARSGRDNEDFRERFHGVPDRATPGSRRGEPDALITKVVSPRNPSGAEATTAPMVATSMTAHLKHFSGGRLGVEIPKRPGQPNC